MPSFRVVDLVRQVFGQNASIVSVSREDGEVSCILYESFQLICGANGDRGTFYAATKVGDLWQKQFLGESVSLNSDADSVTKSLQQIDGWCRSKLPSDFIQRLEDGLVKDRRMDKNLYPIRANPLA